MHLCVFFYCIEEYLTGLDKVVLGIEVLHNVIQFK